MTTFDAPYDIDIRVTRLADTLNPGTTATLTYGSSMERDSCAQFLSRLGFGVAVQTVHHRIRPELDGGWHTVYLVVVSGRVGQFAPGMIVPWATAWRGFDLTGSPVDVLTGGAEPKLGEAGAASPVTPPAVA